MSDDASIATCDVCGESFPKVDEHTVEWAALSACSADCKQHWVNSNRGQR